MSQLNDSTNQQDEKDCSSGEHTPVVHPKENNDSLYDLRLDWAISRARNEGGAIGIKILDWIGGIVHVRLENNLSTDNPNDLYDAVELLIRYGHAIQDCLTDQAVEEAERLLAAQKRFETAYIEVYGFL